MNLNDTLHGYDESLAKVPSDMPGEIGAVINGKRRTNVVGRGGFVYVRLRTNLSEPIQAYNDKVFPGFGVAVIVRWVNSRYEVIGRDSQRYQEWEADTPEIAKHGSSHSLDVEGNNIGTDPVWVYPYQVIPGLVSPYGQSGAQNVYVHPFPILYGGEWMYVGNTGTPSLTAYSPASGTVLVLIAMDAETGNPALFASTGSYITWNTSGSNNLVPNLPYLDTVRYLPLSFAILQSGTTSMSWSNLRDLRQWMSTSQSGTGGGASLEFQDEGVPLGAPGTVNFVGGNVSVTMSGTVARVFVTGSSGGTSDHESLTGLLGGSPNNHWHLTPEQTTGLVSGTYTNLHFHSGTASQDFYSAPSGTPIDADRFGYWNSVTGLLSHVTWSNIKSTLKTYFDQYYLLLSSIDTVIFGCQGLWNSATSLTTGIGYVQAENGDKILITSPLTVSSLSLSANTEYHIYVYLSGGSPAMEVVTTAPVLWKGTAYSKTGDTSRRYIYSIRTATASGNVRKFIHNWVTNKIVYVSDNLAATPYRVLSNGKATTSTAVSLSGIVPVTAIVGFGRFANTDSTYVCSIGIDAVSSTSYDNYFNTGLRATLDFAIANQNIYYFYDGGTPANGFYIDILGYTFKR